MTGTWFGSGTTRSAFLRRAAGAAIGLGIGASGSTGGRRLQESGEADAALVAERPTIHRFHSRPDLVPPFVAVTPSSGALAPGALFLAPSSGPGQRGTLIVDNRGEPLWFRPTTPATAMNFRAAVFKGAPVLTWWEGKTEHGLGEGTHVILDASYRELARFPAGNGLESDLHEFIVTPSGTALVTAWELAERDLRSLGGSAKGKVVGGVVQELALPSGEVLFEWHSLDHVRLDESHAGVGPEFDYFHVNSVAPTDDGNLLVSARNTWAIYKIDRGSGEVIWRLGGKRSDFAMGPDSFFAWQHDARPHAGGRVSLFDDGAAPQVQPQSRGLVLALDSERMRARVERSYPHTPPLLATALGNTQLLANGNVLVGYGTEPYFTEFSSEGRVLLDAKLPTHGENYRALRFEWVGRPTDRPTLAVSSISGTNQLYASWNGATEVEAWQLRSGSSAERLTQTHVARRSGFETALAIPARARYAAVVALDRSGKPLGRSSPIQI